ncbi:MAG TPA: nuclear transport factor 2 family protein [Bryobacteraceae bacterium]|nr:nuclear transport factor 2 family protein [Bryobacteraceae bacterium]
MSDPVETVRSFHDAFAARDADRIAALFHPEIEWTAAENFIYADQSPYRGVDGVLHLLFGRVLSDWDVFSTRADEILGGGDIVIASGRFRGIYKANRARVDAQIVEVFQFKDGRIAKVQTYTDTAQFKEAVSRVQAA